MPYHLPFFTQQALQAMSVHTWARAHTLLVLAYLNLKSLIVYSLVGNSFGKHLASLILTSLCFVVGVKRAFSWVAALRGLLHYQQSQGSQIYGWTTAIMRMKQHSHGPLSLFSSGRAWISCTSSRCFRHKWILFLAVPFLILHSQLPSHSLTKHLVCASHLLDAGNARVSKVSLSSSWKGGN